MTTTNPAEYWENRYRENGKSWSGNVNASLEREIAGTPPGSALDLGCGEGGDALWLAHQGWSVTAVDIAPAALAIGAAEQQPGDDITWVAADLAQWQPPTTYDLVTAFFLHSPVELERDSILRRAATAVAPGGMLLIVGHAGRPHWVDPDATADPHAATDLPTPDAVLEGLFPDGLPRHWSILTNGLVERIATGPHGEVGPIVDTVLKLRRAKST